MPRPRPVSPPDDFAESGRALWLRVQRHLRGQNTWQDTDAPLLESYVRCLLTARAARQAAGSEPFVAGSQGQLVAHPGVKVAADAERDAHRYATSLLLTPEARKRHEIEPQRDGDDLPFLHAVG